MNKIILIGNLTHDPETRSTSSGVTVTTFTIAVNRRFSQGGEKVTDFFRINAWRQLGETCSRYLSKGRKVAVIGELQARTYEAKDGTTRMTLDVSADEVEFLTPRSADDSGSTYSSGTKSSSHSTGELDGFVDIQSDDIPF
ncbi:MAG: single-stranded DNA-binding protein [Clostridia bacterium]|jgi:single-strand DNA-binding protein|nr:single-stranded DNA-binding protein [Clostridia bacterium]MBQ3663409.1 single-stranded DNA-binding protein [Clostridia bacterium]MCR5073910.1 single-stranded DNA-binding protein [Clostridiales bacterium]